MQAYAFPCSSQVGLHLSFACPFEIGCLWKVRAEEGERQQSFDCVSLPLSILKVEEI